MLTIFPELNQITDCAVSFEIEVKTGNVEGFVFDAEYLHVCRTLKNKTVCDYCGN